MLGGLHVRSGPKSLKPPANTKTLRHCHGTSGRLGLAEEDPRPAAEWQGLRATTKSRETAKSRGKTSSESKTSFSPAPQRADQEKQSEEPDAATRGPQLLTFGIFSGHTVLYLQSGSENYPRWFLYQPRRTPNSVEKQAGLKSIFKIS